MSQPLRWIRGAYTRLPAAAWLCAVVALLNALAWSLIVPIFQVSDEQAHVAYAQYLAETGRPPGRPAEGQGVSEEQRRLMQALGWKQVVHRPGNRPLDTPTAHRRLERLVAAPASRTREGRGGPTTVNYSPLYYAAAATAYRLSPATALPDRVHAMRLVSVLLAAVTTLFVFLFLREIFPATPWMWPVGALAVAFQPMFGFISGGVNNDNLVTAAASATLLSLACCFRRGLTVRRGLALGVCLAIGVLAKPSMVGLVPGCVLGLGFLVYRAPANRRGEAVWGLAAAVAIATVLLLTYSLVNSTIWDRGLFFADESGQAPKSVSEPGNLPDRFSYIWQFYLPRLPFMSVQVDGYPLRDIWFEGFVGRFGWLDYGFSRAIYDLALVLAALVVGLAARALLSMRAAVRSRLAELATYAVMAIGLLGLLNSIGYDYRLGEAEGFEQGRYLLPLLGLYGALVALAARGVGARYGPAVGVLIVSIAAAHSLVAMLLTVTRYYG